MSRPATGRRIDVRRAQLYEGSDFSPRSIPGLLFWLRADLGITLAATKVAAWADQSGNGRDFAQGTDARRPVYAASSASFAGRPCVQYSAAQILSSLASLPACPVGVTVSFAIANTPAQSTVLSEIGTGATANAGGAYIDNPIRYRGLYHNPVSFFTQHAFTTPPASSAFVYTIDPTAAAASQVRAYDDDVVGASVGASASPGTIDANTWHIGARTPLTAPCTADIAEVCAWDRVLTSAERAALYAYQQARFG